MAASEVKPPRSGGGMGVSLIVAIVVAAIVAAGVSYVMTPKARAAQTIEVYMIAGDFGFDAFLPGSFTASKGDTLNIHIVNTEDELHDFRMNIEHDRRFDFVSVRSSLLFPDRGFGATPRVTHRIASARPGLRRRSGP